MKKDVAEIEVGDIIVGVWSGPLKDIFIELPYSLVMSKPVPDDDEQFEFLFKGLVLYHDGEILTLSYDHDNEYEVF